MLHDLSHIQLGSPDDVHAFDICGRLLRNVAGGYFDFGMAGVGAMCDAISGAILGKDQCLFEVFGMYRQTVHSVLSEVEVVYGKTLCMR